MGSQRHQSEEVELWVVGFQEDGLSLSGVPHALRIVYVSGMIYITARA